MISKEEIQTLIDTVKNLVDHTQEQVSVNAGYSEKSLTQIISKGDRLDSAYKRILMAYKEELKNSTYKPVPGFEWQESFREARLNRKNNSEKPDIKVRGGFTNLSNITVYEDDPEKYEVVGSLPQTLFPRCDYAERAKGDSMYPIIVNQALLVGKRCTVNGVVWGEKYIIKTKSGLDTTKFIHPATDKGKIILIAHNKSVPPQEINKADVIFACRVYWIVNPT